MDMLYIIMITIATVNNASIASNNVNEFLFKKFFIQQIS